MWQENGENDWARDVSLPIEGARCGHARMLEKGFSSELVHCAERDGFPMLSFTASRGRWSERAKPSAAYLLAIAEGLRERRNERLNRGPSAGRRLKGVAHE